MRSIICFLITGILLAASLSCSKDEGVGGTATIRGKVIINDYNDDFSILLSEYNAAEEDVYIIYGDDKTFGDQVETNYDGTFEFNYLLPGDYTVYVYSEDSSSSMLHDTAVIKNITISRKDDVIDAGTFVKINVLDFDDGNSTISGKMYKIEYDPATVCTLYPQSDTVLAQEQEVYILYGDHEFYDDRIRTHYDGTFMFSNLIKGKYQIYAYSKDITCGVELIPVVRQAEITEENQDIELSDIYIANY
jgi:hypothetical protein